MEGQTKLSEAEMITQVKLVWGIDDYALSQVIHCAARGTISRVKAGKGSLTDVSHKRLAQLFNSKPSTDRCEPPAAGGVV